MDKNVIEALHKSIQRKWNPICMGDGVDNRSEDCPLCKLILVDATSVCSPCPFTGVCSDGAYNDWEQHFERNHSPCPERKSANMCDGCELDIVTIKCPTCAEKAEAVLEKLVMCLPPEEREIYGG